MDNYTLAWIVICVATLIGALAFYHALSFIPSKVVRTVIVVVAATFFVVPASIPNVDGTLAPAFLVFVFETFFQRDGAPAASLAVLSVSMLVAMLATALIGSLWSRGKKRHD